MLAENLLIENDQSVLEIGTGSGYQAAVLASMGARVYTIERHRDLYLKSRMLLTELKYRVHFFYGDGYLGLPTYGPFDRILITAAIPEVPETLIGQLKPGGKLVMPLGNTNTQIMTLLEKTSEGEIKSSEHGRFVFVPMLKGKG